MPSLGIGIRITKNRGRVVLGSAAADLKKLDGAYLKLIDGGFMKLVNQS